MRKKTSLFFLAACLLAGKASGFDFTLKIWGGWSWIDGGDLNAGIRGERQYYQDLQGANFSSTYRFGEMHQAPEFCAEAVLALSSHWSLSLSVGYLYQKRTGEIRTHLEEHENYSLPSGEWGTRDFVETRFTLPRYARETIPITLGLNYAFFLGEKWTLSVGGGGGLYFGRLSRDEEYEFVSEAVDERHAGSFVVQYVDRLSTVGESSEETTCTALGLDGRLGLDYRLSSSMSLTLEILGRWVNMNRWEGRKTEASQWEYTYGLWGAYSSEGEEERTEDGKLWRADFRDERTGKSYPVLLFREGADRPANINLSGFSVRVGLAFRFGKRG